MITACYRGRPSKVVSLQVISSGIALDAVGLVSQALKRSLGISIGDCDKGHYTMPLGTG